MAAQGSPPAGPKPAPQGKVAAAPPVKKAKDVKAVAAGQGKGVVAKQVAAKAVPPGPKVSAAKPATATKPAAVTLAVVTEKKAGGARSSKKPTLAVKQTVAPAPVAVRKRAAKPAPAMRQAMARKTEVAVDSGEDQGLPAIASQISSKSVMVMDAGNGATLFAKSPDSPRQPASTIKIVTAMIALKSLQQDEIVAVSHHASAMPSSKIYLDPKQNYRANDLINAVMLASANDASVALAEKIAGSEDRFANLMTLSARIWGAQNTICRTASGLTAEGQQSTARDLANLFRYAMQNNEFARRMGEKTISTSYGKTLLNHNKALWRVDGADAGKTGYTVAARQTYVGQFTRGGQTIVVAIMGSESMWADLKKLVDYGFSRKNQEQLAQGRAEGSSANTALVHETGRAFPVGSAIRGR